MGIGEDEEYLVLKGQDFDLMVEVAEDVEDYLEELDNIRSVRLSVRDNSREVHLDFNSLLMSEYKVTLGQVMGELNAFENEISSGVNFRHDNEEYEIMLKYDDFNEEHIVRDRCRVVAYSWVRVSDLYGGTQRFNQSDGSGRLGGECFGCGLSGTS